MKIKNFKIIEEIKMSNGGIRGYHASYEISSGFINTLFGIFTNKDVVLHYVIDENGIVLNAQGALSCRLFDSKSGINLYGFESDAIINLFNLYKDDFSRLQHSEKNHKSAKIILIKKKELE